MRKNGSVTAFYLETLLLIVVFIGIILLLTQVCGMAQLHSAAARQLTDAVVLAGNAAEAFSASKSPEELLERLNENNNAVALTDTAGVEAVYGSDLSPDSSGCYRVSVTWQPEQTETGTMVSGGIRVMAAGKAEPVYHLETKVFLQEAAG